MISGGIMYLFSPEPILIKLGLSLVLIGIISFILVSEKRFTVIDANTQETNNFSVQQLNLLFSEKLALFLSIFICSFVFLVCSLINSPLLSSLLVAFIYLASELSYNALRLTSQAKYVFIKLVSEALYYVLPNYHKVDLKIHAIYGVPISALYMVEITLYTCFYVILCYFVAVTIFGRKDH